MTKKLSKETKIKHRFGAFELRLSDAKVEIEEVVNRSKKFVYSSESFEYGLFLYLLSESSMGKKWTAEEHGENVKFAESLVYMMTYTTLIFSNPEFREKYWNLITEAVQNIEPTESPDDDKIIEEMKTEHEAKKNES